MTAHDIVLYGATGFVGQLVAECLARHPEGSRFSWAIGGRNPDKLSALRTVWAQAAPRPAHPIAKQPVRSTACPECRDQNARPVGASTAPLAVGRIAPESAPS